MNLSIISKLINYSDVGLLFDSHKAQYQTRYLFTYGGTIISWHSTKKFIIATSSNHVDIIVNHETNLAKINNLTHQNGIRPKF